MNTLTVGEAIEMLQRFDPTDRLIGKWPQTTTSLPDGDVKHHAGSGIIYEICKYGCRQVAIKVSDE